MLLISATPANAKTWKPGQMASYLAKGSAGEPRYRVKVRVPQGVTFSVQDGYLSISSLKEMCGGFAPTHRGFSGSTFRKALLALPLGFDKKRTRVSSGRGTGRVRFARFSQPGKFGGIEYRALHPALYHKGAFGREYYGFEVSNACMSDRAAMRLARTVEIIPVRR